jgi:Fe-S-cluster containining protein
MEDSTRNTPPSNAIPALRVAPSVILAGMALPPGDNELVQIMDAALIDAARRAGDWLVCCPGCTQCCYGAFVINELDAVRLAVGMETLRAANSNLTAELHRRAQEWLAQYGPEFPGDQQTGRLGTTDADHARFEDYANEAACPALNPATGRCDVYEWRPMTCRVFGPPVRIDADTGDANALGHCELCFEGATTAQIAACEMSVPHELEEKLLTEIQVRGETIVAFALLR